MEKKFNLSSPSRRLSIWFRLEGYKEVAKRKNADLIILNTNVGDIDPKYYKHSEHPSTTPIPAEFLRIRDIYNKWKNRKAIVGIGSCGHLIHAMQGGFMFQSTFNHEYDHDTTIEYSNSDKEIVEAQSHHRQMMGNPTVGKVVAWTDKLAESKVKCVAGHTHTSFVKEKDIEGMFYEGANCLSWQPDPRLGVEDSIFLRGSQAFSKVIKQYLEY